MDDTIRKEAALKGLKYKIAEVESEIRTQVDIEKELRDNIRKEKEESEKLIKEMTHDANVANEKAFALRRKRDTLVTAVRDLYDIFYTPDDAEVEKDWKAESDKWEAMYRTVAAQLDRTQATLYSTETALKAMKTRVRKAEGTYIHPDDDDSEDYDDEVSAVECKARYEAERKMRLELQSKVIALNTQLAAEKGILLG